MVCVLNICSYVQTYVNFLERGVAISRRFQCQEPMEDRLVKKSRHVKIAVAGMAAFGLLATIGCASGSAEADGTTKLVVASFNHADSPETRVLDWWLDEVESLSEGKVTFDRNHQETLCAGTEIVQCVRDGRADIGMTIPSYNAGFFPVSELINLPFQTDNAEAASKAYQALIEENEEVAAEANAHGLRTLFHVAADTALIGANKPIENVADLKGASVRSAGEGIQWAYESVGANPVSTTASEMYEAMQYGLIDAWTNSLSGGNDFKMYEVSDHWALSGLGIYANNGAWISEDAWAKLPEEIQEVFGQATENYLSGAGYEAFAENVAPKCDAVVDSGKLKSWNVWEEAALTEWSDALGDKAIENWKKNVSGVVSDPTAVYSRFQELLTEAEAESSFVSPAIACAGRV